MAGQWSGWRWAVPVVAVVAGLMFATTARTAAGTDLRAERRTELTELIAAEQARFEKRLATVGELRAEVDALVASAADEESARLAAQVADLGAAAGLEPVRGPGLTVALDDAALPPDGIPDGFGPDDFVVHQQDVQAVVNALWAGGAEAVSVMDQRLVTTSAVRCVGNTLILQGRVYAPPYTVTGVGPVEQMQRALDDAPGVRVYRDWVELVGLGYRVEEHRAVALPGYQGPLELRHADPGW